MSSKCLSVPCNTLVYCFVPAVSLRYSRNSTLASALAEFVAALQLVLKLPVARCTATNRYIHFVLRNRSQIHEGLHSSLVCIWWTSLLICY